MRQETSKLIFKSDLFSIFINEYLGGDLMYPHSQIFNDKKHRISDEKISYRAMNHWSEFDLISDNRPAGKGWRKFSYSEITWILIMRELRQIGMSLEKIRFTKDALCKYDDVKGVSDMPYLDFFSLYAFYTQTPISLYVFSDGDAEICNPSTLLLNRQLSSLPNYIEIDLNSILQEVFPFKKFDVKYGNLTYCDDQEVKILDKLKENGLNSLNIVLKDGLPIQIEKNKILNFSEGQHRLLKYGEVCNVVHNGKVTKVKFIEKENL